MNAKLLMEYSMFAAFVLSLATLGIMWRRRAFRDFYFMGAFLAAMALSRAIAIPLLFFRKYIGISRTAAYDTYFISSWIFFFLEYGLLLMAIYSVFRLAMKPFDGLHEAGKLVFRWAFSVSLILALGISVGPHIGTGFLESISLSIHQMMGILSLCLLLFVTFSVRYLGLTYRSRIFGITLGFGIWAVTYLLESSQYSNNTLSVYAPVYLWGTLGSAVTISVWAVYFALPEPERKLILLPTTSPFFFWNRISEALGDDPGHVVVGGFTPEMLAKGELEVLSAASRFAKSREDRNDILSGSPSPLQSAVARR